MYNLRNFIRNLSQIEYFQHFSSSNQTVIPNFITINDFIGRGGRDEEKQ